MLPLYAGAHGGHQGVARLRLLVAQTEVHAACLHRAGLGKLYPTREPYRGRHGRNGIVTRAAVAAPEGKEAGQRVASEADVACGEPREELALDEGQRILSPVAERLVLEYRCRRPRRELVVPLAYVQCHEHERRRGARLQLAYFLLQSVYVVVVYRLHDEPLGLPVGGVVNENAAVVDGY